MNNRKGMSVLELLMVLVVISVLTAILTRVGFQALSVAEKARYALEQTAAYRDNLLEHPSVQLQNLLQQEVSPSLVARAKEVQAYWVTGMGNFLTLAEIEAMVITPLLVEKRGFQKMTSWERSDGKEIEMRYIHRELHLEIWVWVEGNETRFQKFTVSVMTDKCIRPLPNFLPGANSYTITNRLGEPQWVHGDVMEEYWDKQFPLFIDNPYS